MSLGILTTHAIAFQSRDADTSDTLHELVTLAENTLNGKNLESVLSSIAPGAIVVSSSHVVDLHAMLTGQDSSIRLPEDTTRQALEVRLKTNPAEDVAHLLLTTARPQRQDRRYHLFIFMKDELHKWRQVLMMD